MPQSNDCAISFAFNQRILGLVTDEKLVNSQKKISNTKSIGRNAPCPCGSGRKYKRCCLKK